MAPGSQTWFYVLSTSARAQVTGHLEFGVGFLSRSCSVSLRNCVSKYQLRLVCQGGLRCGDHTPENQMLWRLQRQESLCGAGHHSRPWLALGYCDSLPGTGLWEKLES